MVVAQNSLRGMSDKDLLTLLLDVTTSLNIMLDVDGERGLPEKGLEPETFSSAKRAIMERISTLKAEERVHSSPFQLWTEYIERSNAPDGVSDPESAVVQHLLCSWTQKEKNIAYITNWLQSLKESRGTKLPSDFPMGLQLVNLDETLKNNFLAILLPAIDVHLSLDTLSTKVYVRRRLNDLASTTLASDFVYDLRFRILDLSAPLESEDERNDNSLSWWWEGQMAPTLQSLGDNIISSPVASNLMSLLPAGWVASTPGTHVTSGEAGPEEVLDDDDRRARDRAWSQQRSGSPDMDRNRINSADAGTGRVGVYDQAPHRAMRGAEVDMLAYDLDATLNKQEEDLPRKTTLTGSEVAAPAAEHKKIMVEAKLRRLRQAKGSSEVPSA